MTAILNSFRTSTKQHIQVYLLLEITFLLPSDFSFIHFSLTSIIRNMTVYTALCIDSCAPSRNTNPYLLMHLRGNKITPQKSCFDNCHK